MRNRERTAAMATIAMLTSACASLPSFENVETVSLTVASGPIAGPTVNLEGDADFGPGEAAAGSFEASEACGPFLPFCAIFAVPAGAIVGAVAKTTQKLPDYQANALNYVTADVSAAIDLRAGLTDAMRDEGRRRGLTVTPVNGDAAVLIQSASIWWDVSAGNNVAVRMEVDFELRRGREQSTAHVTYKSDSAKVEDWIADDGEPIRQALESTTADTSRLIWERILGADDESS